MTPVFGSNSRKNTCQILHSSLLRRGAPKSGMGFRSVRRFLMWELIFSVGNGGRYQMAPQSSSICQIPELFVIASNPKILVKEVMQHTRINLSFLRNLNAARGPLGKPFSLSSIKFISLTKGTSSVGTWKHRLASRWNISMLKKIMALRCISRRPSGPPCPP